MRKYLPNSIHILSLHTVSTPPVSHVANTTWMKWLMIVLADIHHLMISPNTITPSLLIHLLDKEEKTHNKYAQTAERVKAEWTYLELEIEEQQM